MWVLKPKTDDLIIGHVLGGVQKADRASDLGDDGVGDPTLELLGLGLAGSENQRIEAGLVNHCFNRVSPITVHNMDGILFIVVQQRQAGSWVAESQDLTDLLGHPPGGSIGVDDGL